MSLFKRYPKFFKRSGLIVVFALAIIAITIFTRDTSNLSSAPTAAFCFLVVVLLAAFFGDLGVAITTALIATGCFNYFYLPPFGTFYIAAPADWIALGVFLITAIFISVLTASAARKTHDIRRTKQVMGELSSFGEWLLSTPDEQLSLTAVAEGAVRIFALEYCSIHMYAAGRWQHCKGSAASEIFAIVEQQLAMKDHLTDVLELVDEHELGVRYVQIRQGTTLVGVIAVKSQTMSLEAIGTMAYLVGNRLRERAMAG